MLDFNKIYTNEHLHTQDTLELKLIWEIQISKEFILKHLLNHKIY